MRSLYSLSLLSLLCLTACDKPAHENNLFPLVKGKTWTYQIETVYDDPDAKTVKTTLEIHNSGSAELSDGSTAWVRRTDMGHEYWLQSSDKGISRVAMKAPLKERAIMDDEARMVLPSTLTVGANWTVTTVPYVLRRRNEKPADFRYLPKYQDLPMTFTVLDLDTKVDTPANHFEHCALVEGKLEILLWNDEAFAYKPNHLVQKEWYCPGAGLVQLERVEPTTTKLLQGGVMRMRLLDVS